MTRKYVRKTAPLDGERKKSAVVEFFRLKAAKLPAPLKNAAFGRVKEPTLCGWVKGHATAEALGGRGAGLFRFTHPLHLYRNARSKVVRRYETLA